MRVSYSEHPPLPRPGAAPTTFYYIIPTLPQAGEGFLRTNHALLYRGKAQHVDTVIVDGEVVLRDGRSTRASREDVVRELRDRFSRPLEPSVLETRRMVERLTPHVRRFYEGWDLGQGAPHYRYNSRA